MVDRLHDHFASGHNRLGAQHRSTVVGLHEQGRDCTELADVPGETSGLSRSFQDQAASSASCDDPCSECTILPETLWRSK